MPFLENIHVAEAHRGEGHSRRVLDFLRDHLRGRDFSALLSSSQSDEPAARAWHRSMGFVSGGVIKDVADDGVHEVVFRLPL